MAAFSDLTLQQAGLIQAFDDVFRPSMGMLE